MVIVVRNLFNAAAIDVYIYLFPALPQVDDVVILLPRPPSYLLINVTHKVAISSLFDAETIDFKAAGKEEAGQMISCQIGVCVLPVCP